MTSIKKSIKKGDVITLSNGKKAIVIAGDENANFKNIYVIRLDSGERRVIDRKTLTLVSNML